MMDNKFIYVCCECKKLKANWYDNCPHVDKEFLYKFENTKIALSLTMDALTTIAEKRFLIDDEKDLINQMLKMAKRIKYKVEIMSEVEYEILHGQA